jgi:hypothetical protein
MLNLIGGSNDTSQLTSFVNNVLGVPGAAIHMYGKSECRKGRKMGHITIVGDSDAQVNDRLRPLLPQLPIPLTHEEISKYTPHPPGSGALRDHQNPLVGVVMGSDSDLGVMIPAAKVLDQFDIPYELTIVSAHRTPDRMVQYAPVGGGERFEGDHCRSGGCSASARDGCGDDGLTGHWGTRQGQFLGRGGFTPQYRADACKTSATFSIFG